MRKLLICVEIFLNKLSTNLIKNHDVICIENLSSQNLMKNHKLAKVIGDFSWYEFVGILLHRFVQIVVSVLERNHFPSENGHALIVVVIMIEILTQVLIF